MLKKKKKIQRAH